MRKGLALKLYGTIFLVLISSVWSGGALAATAPQAPGESANYPSDPAFAALWQQVMDEAALTPDQTARLAQELRTLVDNLHENSSGLAALRAQEQTVPAESLPVLRQRLELKEAERDLLVDQAELTLKSFLTRTQWDLVTVAVLHGVSRNHCGSRGHHQELAASPAGMGPGRFFSPLMAAGETLNTGGLAVTLEIALNDLQRRIAAR